MSYYTESQKTISEKIVLATCEAVSRVKLFTLVGSDYERDVDYFVVGVKDSGIALSESSLPLSLNEWNYNPLTKKLLINVAADPKTLDISLTYRFFFSNAPINAPYDLNTGAVVEWLPYISNIGSLGQQLDEEQSGVVLESQSSIGFVNSLFFDDIFDTLIWENQRVRFYSYISGISFPESILLFAGVIESKSFSESQVSFKVKDFVYKLKNKVNLGLFSDTDGIILPSIIGTPKRRIYGKADYVKCASIDATLDGYAISGTVSVSSGTNSLIGSGTSFLIELSQGDELVFEVAGEIKKVAIESIQSATALTLGKLVDFSASSVSVKVDPAIPVRYKNRYWHVSGHKLRSPSTTIVTVESSSNFVVSDISDMFAGDEILVNGIVSTIRRISGNNIVTATSIVPTPSNGDVVEKRPVSSVYLGHRKLEYTRDYVVSNTTEAILVLNNKAEFNITEQLRPSNPFIFTSGGRSISTATILDLRTILKPRDWIRSSNISKPDWYEVLQVFEQSIEIRTPFTGSSATELGYIKNVEYIDESSLVTANCMGMERDGVWIKTASDMVKDLIVNDAGINEIDSASFAKAKSDCNYIVSMVIPESLGEYSPLVRDCITKINESVFGSLYGGMSSGVAYSIFSSTKPETLSAIEDSDIISFSVQTNQKIIDESKINYRPHIDIFTGNNAVKTLSAVSAFVNNLIGIKSTNEKTIYIFEDDKAQIIAQRLCFFKSLSNSVVNLKSKLNLASVNVNDKLYLSLDRLFKRFGGTETRRIGIVSGVKKDGYGCEISVTDLGNIYNRVMSIAPNSAVAYSSATSDDILKWGYIVDNDTETPDGSDTGLGSNIVG